MFTIQCQANDILVMSSLLATVSIATTSTVAACSFLPAPASFSTFSMLTSTALLLLSWAASTNTLFMKLTIRNPAVILRFIISRQHYVAKCFQVSGKWYHIILFRDNSIFIHRYPIVPFCSWVGNNSMLTTNFDAPCCLHIIHNCNQTLCMWVSPVVNL